MRVLWISLAVLAAVVLCYPQPGAAAMGRPGGMLHYVRGTLTARKRPSPSVLPKPGTKDLSAFVNDLWQALHGKCWSKRPVHLIFSDALDVPHPDCQGTWIEFGVFKGATARLAAEWREKHCGAATDPVYGMDTFTGLPEGWYFFKKGDFDLNGDLPDVPDNVELVKGLFNESLPRLIANKTARPQGLDPVSYMHIDNDLYQGAIDALTILNDYIVPGTLLLFDELVNYEHWLDHEVKALWEWTIQYKRRVQVVGKMCRPGDKDGPFNKSPSIPAEWFNKNATWEQSVAFIVVD